MNEYLALLNTPWTTDEVSQAFIFSCYPGLRWVDVKLLNWNDIKGNTLVTRIIQKKTGRPLTLTVQPIAKNILGQRKPLSPADFNGKSLVFGLPTANGATKILEEWVKTRRN